MRAATSRSLLAVLITAMLAAGCAAATPSQGSATPTASTPTASVEPTLTPTRPALPTTTPTPSSAPVDPFLGQVVVTVSGRVRVRSLPEVSDASIMYEPLLPLGVGLRVLGGPVASSGFTWYQVEPIVFRGLEPPGRGWVAIADKDGTPWIALADAATAAAVSAGNHHTCALTSVGGVKCWGANNYGQLGNGSTRRSAVPVDVAGLTSGVVAIDAAGNTACALTARGAVRCWGANNVGQLGDGTTTERHAPVTVKRLPGDIRAIAVSPLHVCALRENGSVLCWGYNQYGELGTGTTMNTSVSTPVVAVPAGDIDAISAGSWNVCAVSAAGAASCWGGNGTLGGPEQGSSIPVGVTGLSDGVGAVSAGVSQTCALADPGEVLCWGGNQHGELGNADTNYAETPVPVAGLPSRVRALDAGPGHTCAIDDTGATWCWGGNTHGELGDGTAERRTAPVAVQGLTDGSLAVTVGSGHTCALLDTGRVMCWGHGTDGQLGNGERNGSIVPVEVDLTIRR